MAHPLPFDIWNEICLRLIEDGSRHDISAFSQVNRVCYAVSMPLFYRSLTLEFWDTQSLQATLFQLNEDRLGRQFIHHTRQLCLICLTTPKSPFKKSAWRMRQQETEYLSPKEPATAETFINSHLTDNAVPESSVLTSPHGSWGRDWEPLASLIDRLQHLERIDFYAKNQFPATLQRAILHHSNCELNVWWPQIMGHSAVAEYHINKDYDSNINVLQIPGLHTLAINLTWGYSKTPGWINLNEMLPFIFVAPNLKHLLLHGYAPNPSRYISPWREFKKEWRNLAADFHRTPAVALESITLSGPHESVLLRLAEAVNLSCLRSLDINGYSDPALLSQIARTFSGLERLFIKLNPTTWQQIDADNEDAISAIQAFAPLKFLCLRGLRSASNLFKVLEQHGRSLKGLILEASADPYLTGYMFPKLKASDIRGLAKSCLHVQELRVQVRRSRGNKTESDIYKALGGFPNLHSLVLDLNFDPRQPPIESTDILELPLIKEMFINASMDEKLAREISNLIASNQPSHQLKSLRLVPFGLRYISFEGSYLLASFGKQLLVSRFPLRVEEISKEAWEGRHEEDLPESTHLPQDIERLLYEIWPSGPGEYGWTTGRHSFPLDVNGRMGS